MGLTELGYTRRTYDDILTAAIQLAKELFGEDIATDDQTPLGKFIRIYAYDLALAEEEIEDVYYSSKPNSARGQSLDRLLVFGGITRNPATEARYSVEVQGTEGYTIPVGFLVGTNTDMTFYCVQEATIGEDGTCLIDVSCTEAGTVGNINAGAITSVVNPDANISAVLGKSCTVLGMDEENDTDLRTRLKAALQGSGSCNENSLRSSLLRIPTVQFAAVVANDGDAADSEGRPPHSFECYVRGGELYEQEIAETIFEKKPIGIKTTGSKAVTVVDDSGTEQTIKYSPTKNVEVTVRAAVKVINTFPEDGSDQIKAAVTSHINGIGIGKSLILSSIYGHIYGIAGVVEVSELKLSTDGGSTFSTANVEVAQFELAVCAGVTLTVEVTN